MKNISIIILLVLLSIGVVKMSNASTGPAALDTTIRILIVRDGTADQGFIDDSVDFLMDAWNDSEGSRPVSITIVNPGLALVIPFVGTHTPALLDQIRDYSRANVPTFTKSARDMPAADLVIGFSGRDLHDGSQQVCGSAQNGPWLGAGAVFSDIGDGIIDLVDRRGAPTYFVAIVRNHAVCLGSFAHELGHLFGGSHQSGSPTPLLTAGRGDFFAIGNPPYISISARTVMSTSGACGIGFSCVRVQRYSSSTHWGTPNRRMIETINKTALSVANFVRKAPSGSIPPTRICIDGIDNDADGLTDLADPDCTGPEDDDESGPPPPPGPTSCVPSNYVPVNVQARFIQCLLPEDETAYEITWEHACPGGYYLVYGNDGAGDYLVTYSPIRSTLVKASGSSSVKVSACSSATCSAKSSPPVPVFNTC